MFWLQVFMLYAIFFFSDSKQCLSLDIRILRIAYATFDQAFVFAWFPCYVVSMLVFSSNVVGCSFPKFMHAFILKLPFNLKF